MFFVVMKNTTILKLEVKIYHGNGDRYMLAAGIYTSPNDSRKTDLEGNIPKGNTPTKSEEVESTTSNTEIKFEATGKTEVN